MFWIIILCLCLLTVLYLNKIKKEHLMVPGVANRDEIIATFIDDKSEFEKNENDFYSRYRT